MISEVQKLASIVESLLFVAEKPLTKKQLRDLVKVKDKDLFKQAIELLQTSYEADERGLCLREVSGGYQLRTKADNSEWVLELNKARPQRLSRAALETLAIVAYKQPLARQEVEDIRGVDCGGVIKTLLEKDLVKIMGKKDEAGNPLIYGTTDGFLSFFGIKSLRELPSLREYAELKESEGALPLEEFLKRNEANEVIAAQEGGDDGEADQEKTEVEPITDEASEESKETVEATTL